MTPEHNNYLILVPAVSAVYTCIWLCDGVSQD